MGLQIFDIQGPAGIIAHSPLLPLLEGQTIVLKYFFMVRVRSITVITGSPIESEGANPVYIFIGFFKILKSKL